MPKWEWETDPDEIMAPSNPLVRGADTAGLRERLKAAKAEGAIRDFALRQAGRATVHLNNGRKVYATNTLDTLAVLHREKAKLEDNR